MKLAELIMAISAWCGNLTITNIPTNTIGSDRPYNYAIRLNEEVASCKKEILSCLQKLKPSQAEAAVDCFAKSSLPK